MQKMKQIKLSTLMLLCAFALCASMLTTFAAYTMTSTPPITGTPTAQATLTLTPSTTTPVSGVSWTLTAHVSDNTASITVSLINNDVIVDTAVTNGSGNAVFTVAPTAAYSYIATATHP